MAEGLGQSWAEDATAREVERVLATAPSYGHLDPETRRELAASLAAVTRAVRADGREPAAGALAGIDDLRGRMGGQTTDGSNPPDQGGTGGSPGAAATTPAPGAPGATPPSTGPASRVGEVARATLNAIDFPSFVASLIQGTFKAIVDASIQQMEAYAELLKNVAKTVDQFMNDNVTDGQAKDYLADEHPTTSSRSDTSGGAPRARRSNQNGKAPQQLPSFLQDLGFQTPAGHRRRPSTT